MFFHLSTPTPDECILCILMGRRIETYPLIKRLEKEAEFFTAGVFVCIVNLDQLPQYLVDYLESPDSFNLTTDALDYYLDQVKIWVIKEKTQKPNEIRQLTTNLETPPQETRKPNESLLTTLTAALVEECLPVDQLNSTDVKTSFAYCRGISHLGHGIYQSPSEKFGALDKYRADYFLVGYSGETHSFQVRDEEVEPVGWITVAEYLSDSYPARRLGGKTVVEKARAKLLQFLVQYWNNPENSQLTLDTAIHTIEERKLQPDFNKRKFPPTVAGATESSPAS